MADGSVRWTFTEARWASSLLERPIIFRRLLCGIGRLPEGLWGLRQLRREVVAGIRCLSRDSHSLRLLASSTTPATSLAPNLTDCTHAPQTPSRPFCALMLLRLQPILRVRCMRHRR
jgi:hypothetical protein